MTRVITPLHKVIAKKKKQAKIISVLSNTITQMVLTRLQRNRKNQQQQRDKQTKPTTTTPRPKKRKTPYDAKAKMQENRKDPKYRFNEDLRRIMRRVQTEENYRPHHKTLTKYQIKLEEINRIREERNWEQIDIFIPPTYNQRPRM